MSRHSGAETKSQGTIINLLLHESLCVTENNAQLPMEECIQDTVRGCNKANYCMAMQSMAGVWD